jgi:hypothetical protein
MANIFSNGGKVGVFYLEGESIPIGLIVGDFKDVLKAKGILTTMSVDGQSGLQVMHTLRKAIYLTTFGERVGNIVIGGIIFQASCDDDPFNPNPGILKFYEWYERNRISTTGLPVSITVTAGLVLDGFLTNMRFGVEDASLGIVQFMMSFIYPPRIVRPTTDPAIPSMTLAL